MWKLSNTRWLNPLAIITVHDDGHEIRVWCTDGDREPLRYTGPERLAVLAHLARNSTPVVPSDADLSGWPYDEDATP